MAEAFACAPALRLEAHERVAALQQAALEEKLARLEAVLERVERRLWLAVYGVAGVIFAKAFEGLMHAVP